MDLQFLANINENQSEANGLSLLKLAGTLTTPPPMPIRILTAVPICDGHDSAINTINLEFIRHGVEVVYLGYNRSAKEIARAALQEDVVAIGISTYNGGHIEFFEEVADRLRQFRLVPEIKIFGGGGGTITREDAEIMYGQGVDRIICRYATRGNAGLLAGWLQRCGTAAL